MDSVDTEIHCAIVTGPTGVIGNALVREMLKQGIKTIAVVRPGSKKRDSLPKSRLLQVVECDLQQLDSLVDMLRKIGITQVDAFFHLGWLETFSSQARNDMRIQVSSINCALESVNVATRLKCSVYIGCGSQAEYGHSGQKIRPKSPVGPVQGYGMAKLCAGQMTRLVCSKNGIRHVWLRVFSVYGPFDNETTMIISTIRSLLAKKIPALTACMQEWDYIYSGDVASAFLAAARKGSDGSVYCLGSGVARPLKEYVLCLRNAIDQSLPLGFGKVPYEESQRMYLCADISTLTDDTGFVPRISFEEGIIETIKWCRETM